MDIIIEHEQLPEISCHPITFGDKTNDVIGMGDNLAIRVKFTIQVCLALGHTDNGIIHQLFGEHSVMPFMAWNYYFARHGVHLLYQ